MPEEATTQNIYTQERLPAWIQPYYTALAESAQNVAGTPYQAYGAQRLADFTDAERAAMSGITSLGTSAGPIQQQRATSGLNSAQQMAMGLGGQGYSDLAGIAGLYGNMGGMFGQVGQQAGNPMMAAGRDWSPYMDPYTKNVTDIAAREALRMGDIQRSELGSRAAHSGAFGGYRHGLGEQSIDRGVRQQVSDLRTRGLEQAFNRGIGLFEGDRAAQQMGLNQRMQALQGGLGALGGQQSALMGANQLFGSGIGQLAGIASQQGQLGAQEQRLAMDRLGAMQRVGEQQRALQQGSLDIGYQDFLNQRQYPQQQLSWMGSILGGFPQQMNQNQQYSTFQQQPGLFQSMMGSGLAGLGLYSALQQ